MEHPVVGLLIRGDHTLNPLKAEKLPLVAAPFAMASLEAVARLAQCGPGFVGPKGLNIPLIADPAVASMANFICGANQEDTHYAGFNWDRDCPLPEIADLRLVQAGDRSPDGKGLLQLTRGIEVGHIFQLGDKYSKAMQATVLNESGTSQTLIMGCYGIGVSRIVAASIEQYYDERGIVWPAALAPFQVILIPINLSKSTAVQIATESLYQELLQAGIEVLLDDREERAGVLFADAELIGIPHRVVISDKMLEAGNLEYKARTGETLQIVAHTKIVSFLKNSIAAST
jgi:prolyl-tRNA synthetase